MMFDIDLRFVSSLNMYKLVCNSYNLVTIMLEIKIMEWDVDIWKRCRKKGRCETRDEVILHFRLKFNILEMFDERKMEDEEVKYRLNF